MTVRCIGAMHIDAALRHLPQPSFGHPRNLLSVGALVRSPAQLAQPQLGREHSQHSALLAVLLAKKLVRGIGPELAGQLLDDRRLHAKGREQWQRWGVKIMQRSALHGLDPYLALALGEVLGRRRSAGAWDQRGGEDSSGHRSLYDEGQKYGQSIPWPAGGPGPRPPRRRAWAPPDIGATRVAGREGTRPSPPSPP